MTIKLSEDFIRQLDKAWAEGAKAVFDAQRERDGLPKVNVPATSFELYNAVKEAVIDVRRNNDE